MDKPAGFDRASRLAKTVRSALSGRVTDVYLDLSDTTHGVTGVLYDAFVIRIGFDVDRGTLAAGIMLEGGRVVSAPFGRRFTLDSDEKSVASVLAQMEEWARLRLPDKYLERFGSVEAHSAPDRTTGWVRDRNGVLPEDRLGLQDHEIWPITRLQAGQAITMIETGNYRPLQIPGVID